MKNFLPLLVLLSITSAAFANPRCLDLPEPTQDIIEGTFFDDGNRSTYYEYARESKERLNTAEVLSSKEPRFVVTKKLVYASALGEGCKTAFEYILIDYTAQLPSGEVCDDTFVQVIDNNNVKFSRSCVKERLPFLPLYPFMMAFEFVEGLENCDSRKCNIKSSVNYFNRIKDANKAL